MQQRHQQVVSYVLLGEKSSDEGQKHHDKHNPVVGTADKAHDGVLYAAPGKKETAKNNGDRHTIADVFRQRPQHQPEVIAGTFVRIGPADRYELKYKVLTHEDALSFGFGKFNKKDVCAFVIDDKVYLCSRDMTIKNLKWIDIRGVFQDPMAAGLFANVAYDENSAYPIGEDMVQDIEKLIYTEKLAPLLGEREDTNNNGANDIINVGLGGKR